MLKAGLRRLLLAAGLLGLAASGCHSESIFGRLPESLGGLPADAPADPKTPYQYPAVHDMPPPRNDKTLSDDQQLNLLNQLESARDSQVRRADEDKAADEAGNDPPKAADVTKKKPSAAKKPAKSAAQAGAKANP